MSASTNRVFFSGETEARAVLAAANHFGVSPKQVVFDRVEKRHGFVKHRRVVIRVDPERVGSAPAVPAPNVAGQASVAAKQAPVAAKQEVPAESGPAEPKEGEAVGEAIEDVEEVLALARSALRQLLELADLEVTAEMVFEGGRLEIEIEGVDQEVLTEDEGQVLLALQHLLPRVMYGELGRIVPCRLDSGGYQRRKEGRLQSLARRAADEVVSRGGMRTLRPMNPADRRIVHLALADDPEVETESQGNGYFKRVNIRGAGASP